MKKRILTWLLTLSLLCTLLSAAVLNAHAEFYSGNCGAEGDGDNLTWNLDTETGELTISGTGAMEDYVFSAPWYFDRSSIKAVSLPQGLTNIGTNAFNGCTGLTSVTIPDSVTQFGEYIFHGCTGLTNVTLPDSVTYIGDFMFWECTGLTSFTIPDSVTSIGGAAFLNCTGLTSVTIPDSVTNIGYIAFEGCTALTSVTIGSKVKIIGGSAFRGCTALTSVTIPASVTSIGEYAFGYTEGLKKEGFTIVGTPGSAAEQYAKDNGFAFEAINGSFTDVSADAYYAEPVAWAVAQGVTTGTSPTTFSPDSTCTRGQVVTFLWRAKGCPEPTSTDNPFTDVKESDYFYKAVLWAKETGVTSGTGATTFSPGNGCTRAQVVTFLWRAEGKPAPESASNPFTDVPEGQYYYDAVLWAVGKGVTTGTGATTFSPDKTCTRGQIVTFLYRDMAE